MANDPHLYQHTRETLSAVVEGKVPVAAAEDPLRFKCMPVFPLSPLSRPGAALVTFADH